VRKIGKRLYYPGSAEPSDRAMDYMVESIIIDGEERMVYVQSQFVDLYFHYGRYGVIVVEGWDFNSRLLYVRSLLTDEEFTVVPQMLVEHAQANAMQVIALAARGASNG